MTCSTSLRIPRRASWRRAGLAGIFAALLIYADLPTRRPFPGHARVRLTIRTPDGKPTGLRLRVTNAAGEYFAPLGHMPAPDPTRRMSGDLILGDGDKIPLEVHALVYDGTRLPASYANFYIVNGGVILPTFDCAADAIAIATLQRLFPGRQVVSLPATDLVWGLGAAHCLTQQHPA